MLNFKKVYFFVFISFVFAQSALAGRYINDTSELDQQTSSFLQAAGFAPGDINSLPNFIATIIKVFLSLLGIIFLILVIIAGFNWMTAGGNDDKVASAKKTLFRAIIGLMIIAAAYVITYFIFSALDSVSGPPSP